MTAEASGAPRIPPLQPRPYALPPVERVVHAPDRSGALWLLVFGVAFFQLSGPFGAIARAVGGWVVLLLPLVVVGNQVWDRWRGDATLSLREAWVWAALLVGWGAASAAGGYVGGALFTAAVVATAAGYGQQVVVRGDAVVVRHELWGLAGPVVVELPRCAADDVRVVPCWTWGDELLGPFGADDEGNVGAELIPAGRVGPRDEIVVGTGRHTRRLVEEIGAALAERPPLR